MRTGLCVLFAVSILPDSLPGQSRLNEISSRKAQVGDSAALTRRAKQLQATFERRRRRMLPRFYTGEATHCLIVGRFCEWHPNLSNYVVPDEGKDIRRARAELLRDLEQAGAALPGDDWIIGQRIRYLAESRDTSATTVARSCAATRWWCDALLGFALHVNGRFAAADSAFAAALDAMPSATRCHWINISPLLDDDLRVMYRRLPCGQREAAVARIWWLADPLYMVPGNERRTEHYSRVLHTALQQHAVNTYGATWGGDLAELILRFGWAEKWTQQPSASMYPGVEPRITGHERHPGFHFFLTRRPPDDVSLIADSLWELGQSPLREQYAPLYAKAFAHLDAQVARFRRGDSTVVVAAYDVSADTLLRRRKFDAGLVVMGDESTTPAMRVVTEAPAKGVMTVMTPWKSQLVGVEILARDSAAAARWRSGFAEIPLEPGRISVSDLLFVDGAPALPSNLDEAVANAHGGTVLRRNRRVALFWELYGTAPADSALPISLTLTPRPAGVFRSALRVLRIAPKVSPLSIRWQENGAAGVLSARSLLLDLSQITPGKYTVRLDVGDVPAASTSRLIEIR